MSVASHSTAEAKDWLASLVGSAPFGTIAFDLDGYCTLANAEAATIFGQRVRELVDQPLDELFGAWPEVLEQLRAAAQSRGALDLDEQRFRGRWYRVRARNVLHGRLVVIDDVTSRCEAHRAQRQLAQRLGAANSELRQFTDLAAHDMKAPIRNMVGLLEQLDSEDAVAESGRPVVEMLRRTVQVLDERSRALNDVLRSHDVPDSDRSSSDFEEVYNGVLAALQKDGVDTAEVQLVLPNEIARPLHIAASQLHTVLLQLISNGLKFAVAERPTEVCVELVEREQTSQISVVDNGSGFDVERHGEQVFQLFRSLHADVPGAGVGLNVVQAIVTRHQGTVHVESVPGQGARFVVELGNEC